MSVTGTPTISKYVTVEDIRAYLRDYAGNNILLDSVQFTNPEIERAMMFAIDEWNVMTPVSSDGVENIPRSILLLGTSAWLMSSESFLQLRNQATYQDGDVAPIGVDDKTTLYQQLAANIKEEWKMAARQFKIQRNMDSAYGSLSSGYRNVGRFRG